MRKKIGILIFLIFAVSLNPLWAYDGKVHRKINENAANPNNSSLDEVLKIQIGIAEGIDAELKKDNESKTIKEWIVYAGEAEDFGMSWDIQPLSTRAFNHFHDPLKDWDNAGLDSIVDVPYRGRYWRDPTSAILWGLDPDNQDFSRNTTGDWSWEMAREYYYIYLTGKDFEGNVVAGTKNEREANFADSFRSLGQVMHLVEDMSVPLHTRNDVHVFPIIFGIIGPKTFESYTLKNKDILNYSAHAPDPVLLSDPQPDPAYGDIVSISGLFDRNQYNGDSIPADNNIIGLAEYSNANFLTEDTMWTYPHPNLSDTNANNIVWLTPEQVVAEDSNTDNRLYIRKTQGEQIHHLAAVDYWTADYVGHLQVIYEPFILDEECWKEYADKLIPRAVGYSASLLDYFFRGAIEITLPDNGVYALTDLGPEVIDPSQQGFDHITLLAKNISTGDEEMIGGTVTLIVKYKLGQGDQFQNSPPATSDEFYYIVKELEGTQSIPRITSSTPDPVEFEFNLSENQIPLWATDVYIYLVYKGGLGQEEGAIAVGFKDICEPTPIDLFNVMDKVCLFGELKNSGSNEAIALVDENENGIVEYYEWDVFPHDADDIFIRFSPANNPVTASPDINNVYYHPHLSPGETFRLFFLSDYQLNRSVDFYNTKIDDRDQCDSFHGRSYVLYGGAAKIMGAIMNQTLLTAPFTRYTPTSFSEVRGINTYCKYFFDNLQYPLDQYCDF